MKSNVPTIAACLRRELPVVIIGAVLTATGLARVGQTIDAILVPELSRWGWSTQDLVQTLDDLHGWKVSVLVQTEGFGVLTVIAAGALSGSEPATTTATTKLWCRSAPQWQVQEPRGTPGRLSSICSLIRRAGRG